MGRLGRKKGWIDRNEFIEIKRSGKQLK